jgi:hypothetical protein
MKTSMSQTSAMGGTKTILNQKKITSIEANAYGGVDIRKGLPHGLTHIPKDLYGATAIRRLCDTLGCPHADALVGFDRRHVGVFHPILNGLVIPIEYRRAVTGRLKQQNKARDAKVAARFIRQYGKPDNALLAAAQAMFALNRYCKNPACRKDNRRAIYALKSRLIKRLYQAGKCVFVHRHNHAIPIADECFRCDGYRCGRCTETEDCFPRHDFRFYLFTFEVGGARFTWHEPKATIDYPVKLPKAAASTTVNETSLFGAWQEGQAKAKALVRWVLATLPLVKASSAAA